MPPRGRRHPTFSSFARCLARVRSAPKFKRHTSSPSHGPASACNPSHHSSGAGIHAATAKSKQKSLEILNEHEYEDAVQADFAFYDPKPGDFHGVKNLLQNYLDKTQWELSGFVDLILGQTTVGSVVKIEDDEDDNIYSVVSAVNLGRYKDQRCIMELKEFLLKVCHDADIKNNLALLLREQAQEVGLLISQRVINLPLQLLPPLYDGLFDEVSWATEDEPTEELRKSFSFKCYLAITKIYKIKNPNQCKAGDNEPVLYIKAEDEIFFKLSSWSFIFPLCAQMLIPHELKNYNQMGLVMLIKEDKIPKFREELKSFIMES